MQAPRILQVVYFGTFDGTTSATLAGTITGVRKNSALLLAVTWQPTFALSNVRSDNGQAFVAAPKGLINDATNNQNAQCFRLYSASEGTHVVTTTFAGANSFLKGCLIELEGANLGAAIDEDQGQHQQNPGTGADAATSTATATTKTVDDLIIGIAVRTGGARTADATAGTGYTLRGSADSSKVFSVEDKAVAALGTQTATFTLATDGATADVTTFVIAIRPPSADVIVGPTPDQGLLSDAEDDGFALYDVSRWVKSGVETWVDGWLDPPVGGATTHASTGVLSGAQSTLIAAAVHKALHTTTGVVSAGGARVTGTAANFTPHATSGVIRADGSRVVGSSARTRQHATTSVLRADGARVTGSANRTRQHATTGALIAAQARLIAAAARTRVHSSTGALAAIGAISTGDALRTPAAGGTTHTTTGALSADGATVTGASQHKARHFTTGVITNSGANVTGASQIRPKHVTTGAIAATGASVTGAAARKTVHATSGVMRAGGSDSVGFAARKMSHATDGVLFGPGAIVIGSQPIPDAPSTSNAGAGHPVDWQVPRRKRTLKEQPEKHLRHILDKVVAEYYGEILESDAPRTAKAEAANAVRPYVSKDSNGARLPKPARVDWERLQLDADAVATLIAIWNAEVAKEGDEDDEEFFLMMS
jgi:hypothetical protein